VWNADSIIIIESCYVTSNNFSNILLELIFGGENGEFNITNCVFHDMNCTGLILTNNSYNHCKYLFLHCSFLHIYSDSGNFPLFIHTSYPSTYFNIFNSTCDEILMSYNRSSMYASLLQFYTRTNIVIEGVYFSNIITPCSCVIFTSTLMGLIFLITALTFVNFTSTNMSESVIKIIFSIPSELIVDVLVIYHSCLFEECRTINDYSGGYFYVILFDCVYLFIYLPIYLSVLSFTLILFLLFVNLFLCLFIL
jgi:hypothetical protein